MWAGQNTYFRRFCMTQERTATRYGWGLAKIPGLGDSSWHEKEQRPGRDEGWPKYLVSAILHDIRKNSDQVGMWAGQNTWSRRFCMTRRKKRDPVGRITRCEWGLAGAVNTSRPSWGNKSPLLLYSFLWNQPLKNWISGFLVKTFSTYPPKGPKHSFSDNLQL